MSTSSLLPFTPRLLLHLLQRRLSSSERGDADRPWRCSLASCIVFIDVSGFTSMTEAFASSGLSGLEQLTQNLNAYFSSILAVIDSHHGDLLKVAGDALIVAFYDLETLNDGDGDEEGKAAAAEARLPLLCCRAVSCALALQAAPSFSTGGVTLGMHIGVTSGLVSYIAVGGAQQLWGAAAPAAAQPDAAELARAAVNSLATDGAQPPPACASRQGSLTEGGGSTSSAGDAAVGPSSPLCSPRPPPLQLALSAGTMSPTNAASRLAELSAGRSRWEFLAAGSAFQQLSTAVHDSNTGDVVVSDDTHQRLQHVADVSASKVQGSSGNNVLITACSLRGPDAAAALSEADSRKQQAGQLPQLLLQQLPLSSFLMPALLSRLSAPSRWLGEYRRVTVLFVSLPNPEDCADVAQPAAVVSPASAELPSPPWLQAFHSLFRTLQHCIIRVGGQVRQLLVDDKGCVMIGAFGLPPLAHEDDAARACSAALDLLAAVKAQHPQAARMVSVGVTTGRAWCGAVGSDARKEYAMVGDIVNLSARIMGNAVTRQRGVMCEEETVRACGDRIRFSSNTACVNVKGRSAPITLYEPLEKMRLSTTATPRTAEALFSPSAASPELSSAAAPARPDSLPSSDAKAQSRSSLLQSILALLQPSPGGPARVVVIEGGPGQGKSYLARQVLDACLASGVTLLLGGADSVEQNTPFFALIPLLQDLVRREYDASRTAQGSREQRPLPVSSQQLADSLPSMLPAQDRPFVSLLSHCLFNVQAAGAAEPAVEAHQRPKLLRRLMRALLRRLFSAQPSALLCIEDGHWLDRPSWMLLKEIAEAEPSVRLLLTTRAIAAAQPGAADPQSVSALYGGICRAPRASHFLLAGMDEAASAALAANFLRCDGVSDELARCIHERSDGIPLFIQHLVAYMRQRELISVDAVTRSASLSTELHLLDASLPSSLEGLLASVLDRLHPGCQLALKVASVVGRHFACSLVSASHPMHVGADELREMLETAALQSVVFAEQPEDVAGVAGLASQTQSKSAEAAAGAVSSIDDAFYRFTHQLVRDAAYHALLYQQRRDLHASIADHLAALHSENSTATRSSAHLLAYHYWLALCNADDILIEQPDQRLLQAAIDYLLQSAASSLDVGVVDAGSLFLHRAARCIQRLQDAERREFWELRWLGSVFGTELITNAPVVQGLASEWGIIAPNAEVVTPVTHRCQSALANRLLALLSSPAATAGMSAMRLQDLRFNALMASWLASWSGGKGAALSSAEALEAFVRQADGREVGYYSTEAFFALTNTYFGCNKYEQLHGAFAKLESHAHYHAVLDGSVKLTRYALGVSPIPRVSMNQARYRWLRGQLSSFWDGLTPVMPLTIASGHQPSIYHGWLAVLKTVMTAGQEPRAVELAEKGMLALPAVDSKAMHLHFLMRRCVALTLQVWRYADSRPADAPVTNGSVGAERAPYEADLLSLIRQIIDDGDSLCMMFHFIFQAFPSVVDFRPEMPLAVHEAMLQLLLKFRQRFAANFTVIEIVRMQAALLIRYLQAGQGDTAQHEAEAERLLQQALAMVVYEKVLLLKVVMSRAELRVLQGRWDEAETELLDAMDGLPEGQSSQSFWVRTAQKMLDEVRLGKKQRERQAAAASELLQAVGRALPT